MWLLKWNKRVRARDWPGNEYSLFLFFDASLHCRCQHCYTIVHRLLPIVLHKSDHSIEQSSLLAVLFCFVVANVIKTHTFSVLLLRLPSLPLTSRQARLIMWPNNGSNESEKKSANKRANGHLINNCNADAAQCSMCTMKGHFRMCSKSGQHQSENKIFIYNEKRKKWKKKEQKMNEGNEEN